jgi:hypothetical protein
MSQSSKVERNEYPDYPGLPSAEAKARMQELLEELCTEKPADTERIGQVWRLLNRLKEPQTFRPGPRRPKR